MPKLTRHSRGYFIASLLLALLVSPRIPAYAGSPAAVVKQYSSARAASSVTGDDTAIPRRPGKAPDKAVSVTTGSSVDIGNGTYTFSETDLRVPARAIPIELSRTYRSNQVMKGADESSWHFATPLDSPLGHGWYSPWFVRIGTDGTFVDGEGNFTIFARDANGAFLPNASTGQTLVKTVTGFELRKRGDNTLVFDADGWLRQIRDNGGNTVTLNYGGNGKLATVTDVMGRTVLTFTYNARGRVATVTDIASRTVTYDYDAIDNLAKASLTMPGGSPITLGAYNYDLTDYGKLPMKCYYVDEYKNGVRYSVTKCLTEQLKPEDQFGSYCRSREWYVGGVRYTETTCYAPQYVNNYHGMTGKTNAAGESYTVGYQPKWRNKGIVRSITDPSGRTMNFDYAFTTGVFTYTDYDGRKYKKILNDTGQLVYQAELVATATGATEQLVKKIDYLDGRNEVTTDAAGIRTTEQKDEWGNVIRRIDGEGNEWRYTYTPEGKIMSATDPLGTITRYEYNAAGSRTKETLAAGTPDESATTYTYDQYNQLASTTRGDTATLYSYDVAGNLSEIKDPLGNSTTMTCDLAGNLLTRTVPLIGATTYENFDYKGNPGKVTDPNGTVVTYTYDLMGRVLTVTNSADGGVTSYAYVTTGTGSCPSCGSSGAGSGKIAAMVLPERNRIDYAYDNAGNLARITDNDGNYISYTYDNRGNKIKEEIKDAAGVLQKTLSYTYDAINRQKQTINPDSSLTETGYDKNGNKISLKNPNGNSTTYGYDKANRLVKVTQPGNVVTAYTYDRRNNLTKVTDANGNTTTYEYDKLNRLMKTTSPDTGITTYTYDGNGNLKTKTDAKGVVATYTYDAANRLTKISFPDPVDNVSYAYDTCVNGKGRLCNMTDPSGTTAYEYTKKGQLAKETKVIDGQTFITEYGYDKNGNNTTMKYASGRVVTYTYANDKVSGILNNGTPIANNIIYKPFGGLTTLIYGNGIQQTNIYDQQYRIASIVAGNVQNLSYTYDGNGNITGISDNQDSTKSKTYGYDAIDRLTQAQGPWGNLAYTYDGVGNRLTETTQTGTTTYSYKPNTNQLITVAGEKNYAFGFDANGNTAIENSKTYNYNQNQRLIKVTELITRQNEQGAQIQETVTKGEYVYNGFALRAKKTVNGQAMHFMFDQQRKLIKEVGASSSDYIYLNNNPYAKIENSTIYFIHTDRLGTPHIMTNSSKQIAWEIQGMPFGETISISSNMIANSIRFPGQYYESETGLNQNWFREFNISFGRYLQVDPIVTNFMYDNKFYFIAPILLSEPRKFSNYAYVQNNPISHIDPEGLYSAQKPGCDGIPNILETRCIRKCCDHHDKCFEAYKCSVNSWAPRNCEPKECKYCNLGAVVCIGTCFVNNNGPIFGGPPVTSPWYGI